MKYHILFFALYSLNFSYAFSLHKPHTPQTEGLAEILSTFKPSHSKAIRRYPNPATSPEEMYERANDNIAEIALLQRKDKPFVIVPYIHKKDIRQVMEIAKNNWHNLTNAPDDGRGYRRFKASFKNRDSMNKNGYLTIKVIKNKNLSVIGFITYLLYSKNQIPSHKWFNFFSKPIKSYTAGHIELVAIEQNNRQSGLGKSLLEYAIDDLRSQNAKAVDLYVLTTNLPAIDCYKKVGFEIKDHCGDSITMIKTIKSN